jgi:hypothetical protein
VELIDRERLVRGRERVDNGAASSGVADAVAHESLRDDGVHLVDARSV